MVRGYITKILTQKENDWGRYMLDDHGKQTLVCGVVPGAAVGMYVEAEGAEVSDNYGTRVQISRIIKQEADTCAGARCFWGDGYIKGIGPTKAAAIVNAFGNDSVYLLDTAEGQKMLKSVKGISGATIEKMLETYKASIPYRDIVMFLAGSGTKLQVEKIYEKYGNDAVKVLRENPYKLEMDIDGFGFARADKLALSSGIKPDSVYRIMAAAKHVIETAQSMGGHCFLYVDEIRKEMKQLLAPMPKLEDVSEKVAENAAADWEEKREYLIKQHHPSEETLEKIAQTCETRELIDAAAAAALGQAIDEGYLVNKDGKIYTKQMYDTETSVSRYIVKMCKSNPVRFISKDCIEHAIKTVEKRKAEALGFEFKVTKEQRDAVYTGLMHRISIISGGPGRGKTAISEIIAEAFLSSAVSYDKKDIIMIAPTGRAAQRITESTGYEATTAHRAILKAKSGERPTEKLILCDESSMVDIFLMSGILSYARDCNLILVGDVDQIASVGPGKVLKDLIASQCIPCIMLTTGHRNTGTIAHNSEKINAGMKIDTYVYDKHFVYTPVNTTNALSKIVADYQTKVKEYGIKDVMLCVAMKERGAVSVKTLNQTLQDLYTKGMPQAVYGKSIFRVGDRVMQIKNDYSFEMRRNGQRSLGVFNGERGTVARVMYSAEDESYHMVVAFDDGSIGGYTAATACNLTLAYATTLHKCQGSEAPCMMMAYMYGDYMLLNRALFYTGETRAKNEFRFYGEEQVKYGKLLSAFDIAVGRIDDKERNTSLSEMIREAM